MVTITKMQRTDSVFQERRHASPWPCLFPLDRRHTCWLDPREGDAAYAEDEGATARMSCVRHEPWPLLLYEAELSSLMSATIFGGTMRFSVTHSKLISKATAYCFYSRKTFLCWKKHTSFSGLDVFCSPKGIKTSKNNIKPALIETRWVLYTYVFPQEIPPKAVCFPYPWDLEGLRKKVIFK